ncbi:threonine/serine ThrE exporter family protein [Dermatophilus congolensis]|uniref:Uncharacterized conserved protein n=1 Tax=Dermatophilus congolensis TaxID=1863 RepID=A0A239VJA0_9MICO|nr:threonine/serine exporter family protein [Dermatophilus congolensis]MBO3129143.1 threonine/serine exporter family protein [Dermatophilus congolensis]MBO3132221.1 threonine/serine exporter family protein [Dermatophilus congolensis]MBO3133620.1 threonine/serine exporter family protein [Dermatophilus congolensis]MBO3135853.1 threonine/serine exporter family protein [Dermatophilus congolensis]MBO3138093.1 threonine/serine exporter family protein [Dermatophilus congolensis]
MADKSGGSVSGVGDEGRSGVPEGDERSWFVPVTRDASSVEGDAGVEVVAPVSKPEMYPALDENSVIAEDPVTGTLKVIPRDQLKQSGLFRVRNALRGSAPTWGMDLREINDGVEHAHSRSVIDLAMRMAEVSLATGASAADVTAGVLAVTRAYGLRSVHVDVTFTSIAVTHHRGSFQDPVTMVRTVSVRVPDYERLSRLEALSAEISEGDLPLDEARARFLEINESPHAYARWVVTVAAGVTGLGVGILLGGTPAELVLVTLVVMLVDRSSLWSARRKLAAFFAQIVGGAIPTVVMLGLVAGGAYVSDSFLAVRPSLIVTCGIVVALAGLSVVGAAQDAIDAYYVTAAARSFEVFMMTLGILVGVMGVLSIGQRLGVPSYLIPPRTFAPMLGWQITGVVLAAFGAALSSYSGPVTVVVAAVTGALSWLVYTLVGVAGFDPIAATAAACLCAGLMSQLMAGWLSVPPLGVVTGGIVAFLPGGLVFRGLYYLVEPVPDPSAAMDGGTLLWSAAATGLAIAGGVSMGTYLGRFLRPRSRIAGKAVSRALRRSSVSSGAAS